MIELGWFFDDAQAVDCPGVLGGSSGSPLFDRTDQVVGMITTTTAGAQAGGDCWLNKPCERTADGARAVPDTSYAVSVTGLAGCFPDGVFALTAGCSLPVPGVVAALGVTAVNADVDTVTAELTAPRATSIRTGVAPLTDADSCADPATYTGTNGGGTIAAGRTATAQATVPKAEGFYVWCLQDTAARDATGQGRARARPDAARPDPPALGRGGVGGGPSAAGVLGSGAVPLPDQVRAARQHGLRRSDRLPAVPAGAGVHPGEGSAVTYCYVGADLAGNETPVYRRTLG